MSDRFVWRELHWPRPLDAAGPVAAVRAWAADQHSPTVVLEVRSDSSGIRYLLGSLPGSQSLVERRLNAAVPNLQITEPSDKREPISSAARLKLSTRHRALRQDAAELIVRQLLGALARVGKGEQLVLQLMLGPRRIPLSVPNNSPSSVVLPWYQVAWHGNQGTVDGEKRSALRAKVADHGFAATVRIGVNAKTPNRRRFLITSVFSALRVGEAPGLQARLVRDPAAHLNAASPPWRWPLRLNVTETVAFTGWPIGDDDLPGLPSIHPRQIAPTQLASAQDRVIGKAWAPGVVGNLGYSVTDALRHTWVIGPTGTGKSTLLQNLIVQDLEAGRPVVVIEPNDLISDLLERIPEHRRNDIVLLDCTDNAPVGINPLARHGRTPEVVADGLLATFQALYGEGIGPRSTDILSNCLSVLAHRDDASLVMLPLLLTNPGFRRSLTAEAIRRDPIAAAPFWAWFEGLSDDARSQVIAPLSNKLRPLLRPQLRAVLAQRTPRFNVREVLTENKVLLVPLQKGVLGPDTAELLGALVISEVWMALRERRALPEAKRTPVMIYVDEVQDYLRLPTDLADALATSRSLRAAWHLAHQYRDQLSPTMRAAFEANARSRICFQLSHADARAMAAGQNVIGVEDFTSLSAFHIYAALMRGNALQPWASGITMPSPRRTSNPSDIRQRSRSQYGLPLDQVEAGFAELITASNPTTTSNRRAKGTA